MSPIIYQSPLTAAAASRKPVTRRHLPDIVRQHKDLLDYQEQFNRTKDHTSGIATLQPSKRDIITLPTNQHTHIMDDHPQRYDGPLPRITFKHYKLPTTTPNTQLHTLLPCYTCPHADWPPARHPHPQTTHLRTTPYGETRLQHLNHTHLLTPT